MPRYRLPSGIYSLAMARHGMSVTGIDAREESLRSRALRLGGRGIRQFATARDAWKRWRHEWRTYPLTLFLGLLYHVEDPMLCLRQVASVTGELCVIETQVVDEVEGFSEWGSREWTRPYHGILALIDESGEFQGGQSRDRSHSHGHLPFAESFAVHVPAGGIHERGNSYTSPRRLRTA